MIPTAPDIPHLELLPTTIRFAIEQQLRRYLPTVTISRPVGVVVAQQFGANIEKTEYSIDEFVSYLRQDHSYTLDEYKKYIYERSDVEEQPTNPPPLITPMQMNSLQSAPQPLAAIRIRPEATHLNIFTEAGGFDPATGNFHNTNLKTTFPFCFIEILDRNTINRQRQGLSIQYTYDYFCNVRFYIDMRPNDIFIVPRLREDLEAVDLLLERVLTQLEPWEGIIYETENRRRNIVDGVLHFFFNLRIAENTIPPVFPKITDIPRDTALIGDIREG